jgi:hypothetical protein
MLLTISTWWFLTPTLNKVKGLMMQIGEKA